MNIIDQLSITVKKHPDKAAYVFQDEATTYLEFERKVMKFASELEQLGYKKGDHIALITWNSPYYIIALHGALRIGAVIIPINPMYTVNEMEYMLKNGEVKAIITMDAILQNFTEIAHRLPDVKHFISCESGCEIILEKSAITAKMKSFTQMIEQGSMDHHAPLIGEEETAIILYTSGTTGHPKGTLLSHKNLYYGAKSSADDLAITKDDRFIITLPMFHVFSLMVALNGSLFYGATLLILSKFSPRHVFQIAKDYKATIFAGVPTMYNYLLQSDIDPEEKVESFANMRFCISGGSSMPVTLYHAFQDALHVQIVEGYGLSEAAPVTFNPVDGSQKPGSIGKCVSNMQVKVVDAVGEEVGLGEAGELVVSGAAVMKGYYKMPEETAAALKDGWLYTGDIVKIDEEGYVYLIDRKKDVIIVNGYNVFPREVEEVLYKHPNVFESAVIGVPDQDSGEAIIGYVAVNDPLITKEMLIDFCKKNVTKYKVPSKIIILKELPKNTTGKILKKDLQKQYIG